LKLDPKYSEDIHIEEFNPFFQFLGHSCNIYYKTDLLIKIYNNNKKSIPIIKIPGLIPNTFVNIGSISLVSLYALILVIKSRVDSDPDTKHLYYNILAHLNEMKQYYLYINKRSIFDDTPFQDFTVKCQGTSITPENERQQLIEYRKSMGKKYTFTFDPSEHENLDDINYVFANSSGNIIKNQKHLQLVQIPELELVPEPEASIGEIITATSNRTSPEIALSNVAEAGNP
jgi:hypothetical protein